MRTAKHVCVDQQFINRIGINDNFCSVRALDLVADMTS
jgi:hypothetical protein